MYICIAYMYSLLYKYLFIFFNFVGKIHFMVMTVMQFQVEIPLLLFYFAYPSAHFTAHNKQKQKLQGKNKM